RLKDSRGALAAAQRAEKVGSEDPVVCHALAMYYSESGEFGRAARLEARVAEGSQSDTEATARAAGLYLNAGDIENALRLARKSATEHVSAAHEDLLGRALVASGRSSEGIQHLPSELQLAHAAQTIAFDYQ